MGESNTIVSAYTKYTGTYNSTAVTHRYDRIAESAEQDQTARMCRLILLYTFRKVNSKPVTNGEIRV